MDKYPYCKECIYKEYFKNGCIYTPLLCLVGIINRTALTLSKIHIPGVNELETSEKIEIEDLEE